MAVEATTVSAEAFVTPRPACWTRQVCVVIWLRLRSLPTFRIVSFILEKVTIKKTSVYKAKCSGKEKSSPVGANLTKRPRDVIKVIQQRGEIETRRAFLAGNQAGKNGREARCAGREVVSSER